jgi:hypothetical protein
MILNLSEILHHSIIGHVFGDNKIIQICILFNKLKNYFLFIFKTRESDLIMLTCTSILKYIFKILNTHNFHKFSLY